MPQAGRIAFGQMEAVTFGRPAAEAVAEEARRAGADRVFLMTSGTLNRATDEIAKVRRALGNRWAGLFDQMPPHTPRHAVIAAAAAAREAGADLIATIGGGSVTDGAKAVQLCLANDIRSAEALDDYRPMAGLDGVVGPPPHCKAPTVRQITVPTTLSAGEFSAISGITDERRRIKELFRHPLIIPRAVMLDPTNADSYNNLGEALGELKQYPRALEAFNKAIALDQKLLKAKYNQAVTYDRMGNFRYSEFVFRSLIKNNPNYSLSYDGLAVTLSKAGRAKEAIAFHEKAIVLDPREPSYYFNCAISYLMLGNTTKALEQQEKLKTIDPAVADRLASVIVKHQM